MGLFRRAFTNSRIIEEEFCNAMQKSTREF